MKRKKWALKEAKEKACSLSPTLFNTYVEKLTEKALQKVTETVVRGEGTNTIRYVYNKAVLV